jgi:type IV pilus assembly protein PilQ
VTPQITESGQILLTVNIENSQPDFARAVNGVPSVATQKAESKVLIADGATAVIAGILVDTDSVNVRQVPGFGSIPLIGHLFKNTSTIKSTAELLFFVTPRIKAADALTITAPAQ